MRWASLLSQKSLWLFGPIKPFYVYSVCIQDQSSIILKMVKWNYQWTKRNWLVCELRTLLRFNWFWFQNLHSDLKNYRAFRETGPWPALLPGSAHALFSHSFIFIHLFCINKKYNNSIQKYTKDNTIFQLNYYKIKCGKGKEAYIEAGGLQTIGFLEL